MHDKRSRTHDSADVAAFDKELPATERRGIPLRR